MLSELAGSSTMERLKSALILALLILLAVAIQQVGASRQGTVSDQSLRQGIVDASDSFTTGLTTYDYAHPELLASRLGAVATRAVVSQIRASGGDLVQFQASGIGSASQVWVETFDGHSAQVLIRTDQTISDVHVSGVHTTGLLSANLTHGAHGWQVTSFQWLVPATAGAPSNPP